MTSEINPDVRRRLADELEADETLHWARRGAPPRQYGESASRWSKVLAVLLAVCVVSSLLAFSRMTGRAEDGDSWRELSPGPALAVYSLLAVATAIGSIAAALFWWRAYARGGTTIYAVTDRRLLFVHERFGSTESLRPEDVTAVHTQRYQGTTFLRFPLKQPAGQNTTPRTPTFGAVPDAEQVARLIERVLRIPVSQFDPTAPLPGLLKRLPNGEIVDLREQGPR